MTTNMLGMGIDNPDIRLVVYIGIPRRLRQFAQESGRAGRDGERAKAVIIYTSRADQAIERGREGSWFDRGIAELLIPGYRRVVLDRIMDGWAGRTGYEEGEEAYDEYIRYRGVEKGEEKEMRIAGENAEDEDLGLFLQARDKARAAEQQLVAEARQQGKEVQVLE